MQLNARKSEIRSPIAGADGCRGGWVAVFANPGSVVTAEVFPDARSLIAALGSNQVLLVDVPVGLPEIGARRADRAAREYLGWPRKASVFPAPIRPVLEAGTWEEASRIRRRCEGKGMSRQAWGITLKIGEVDGVVQELDPGQSKVREGHPEVSFRAWAGLPMQYAKKRPAGRIERSRLIEQHFGAGSIERLWPELKGRGVARDDLIDAFAMLWSAERLVSGTAKVLPASPETDACGLRMAIVF